MEKETLNEMSDEQLFIYEVILSGKNAVVDACAGSGKSTTILSIAEKMPSHKFVKITYNSMLCKEIKAKVNGLELKNIQVYTYHGLVKRFYSTDCHTDTSIRNVIRDRKPPQIKIPQFDVLVIDECQDMTLLYFKIIIKFCVDHEKKIQVLILGDYMQGLYDFKGADTRFLTLANKIWSNFEMLKTPHFINCTLRMSYRITNQMAEFVNKAMLNQERLLACRHGIPVVYLRRSTGNAEKYVVNKILSLLEEGYLPADFFVLGGSVKGPTSAIRKMENILVENNIPCHVPMIENEKIEERVIEGKVVFSTFHSVKGRQRKFVFIVGFDHTYFEFIAKNIPSNECPNTLYVACTRATHGLFLIERHSIQTDRPFKFLKMSHIEMKNSSFVEFHGLPQSIFYKSSKENEKRIFEVNGVKKKIINTSPTDLIKFLSESVIEDLLPILERIFTLVQKCEEIEIPFIVKTSKDFYEDVSELNGIAIPLIYFERKKIKQDEEGDTAEPCVLYNIIEQYLADVKEDEYIFLKKYIKNIPPNCSMTSDYLRLSNAYVAIKEKLYFKINQIDDYTWLKDDILLKCTERFDKIFGNELKNSFVEKTIIEQCDHESHSIIDQILDFFKENVFRFTARIDLETEKNVWEIKCTTDLTNDHFIQVIIYAWLWDKVSSVEKTFRLFNVRTGEEYVLSATKEELDFIMISLLKNKYGEKEIKCDDNFVEECISIIKY